MTRMSYFHLGSHQFEQLPTAVVVLLIYWAHVFAFAMLIKRWLQPKSRLEFFTCLTAGFALFGFYIWIVGYCRLLNAPFFAISAIIWAAVSYMVTRLVPPLRLTEDREDRVMVRAGSRGLATVAVLTVLVAAVSGLRGGAFDDDYRWQSATAWVHAGHWSRVPYRLTNGTAMSEMLHVPAATFHSLTAAHWASTSLWVCAAMNAAALGSRLGLSAPVAIVATLSLPVFTSAGSTLNSDVPALAFALGGLTALTLSRSAARPGQPLFIAGLLFAAVLSTKFVVLACLPAALLGMFATSPSWLRRCWASPSFGWRTPPT
jgi:hypothetical protein